MTWVTFREGQTNTASEVHGNFVHIAVGDRVKMAGSQMAATSDAYNLGQGTYRWRNMYVYDFEMQNMYRVAGSVFRYSSHSGTQTIAGFIQNNDDVMHRVYGVSDLVANTQQTIFTHSISMANTNTSILGFKAARRTASGGTPNVFSGQMFPGVYNEYASGANGTTGGALYLRFPVSTGTTVDIRAPGTCSVSILSITTFVDWRD